MARAYGLTFTIDDADDTIKTWRSANLWAKTLWRDLERAAWAACRLHNEAFDVGRLTYSYSPASDMLSCTLPSGRALSYPQPRIAVDERGNSELTAIKASWKPKQGETRWGRIKLYGGMLAENVTQATAACLLRHAMKLTVEDGWPLIGTTHDELLMEVYDDEVDEACGALEAVMRDSPAWAEGLPIACTIDHDNYYRK
jgi:DNA polymerase